MKIVITTLQVLLSCLWAQETDVEIEFENTGEEPAPIERMPEVIHFVEAGYPKDALKLGKNGVVRMEVIISEEGKVDSVALIEGVWPSLDSSALHAMRQFTFQPAIAGGEAIPVAIEYGYSFSLQSILDSIPEVVNYKGLLLEKGTRNPIPEAIVVVTISDSLVDSNLDLPIIEYLQKIGSFEGQYLEDYKLVTTTDAQGFFSFKSLPACSIQVHFPLTGYKQASFSEKIEAGKQIEVEYRLHRESYDDYEIVVYGKAEKTEVAKKTLSMKEVKKVPGFGGDAIKVVRALPGASRPAFISGDVLLRGARSHDTRFFIDGVEIPALFHFGGLRSTYSSDLLSSIDMYPGGFGVRYGGAIGGIVEVKGRSAKTDRWHGTTDVNLIDAGFMLEGPLSEKLSLQMAGRYSYIGDVIREMTKDEPNSVVPKYWDGLIRMDWHLNKDHKAFWAYSSSRDELDITINAMKGGSSELGESNSALSTTEYYHTFLGGLNSTLSPKLKNELRISGTAMGADGEIFGLSKFDATGKIANLRNELQYNIHDDLILKPGLDMQYTRYDFTFANVGATGFLRGGGSMNFSTPAAYMQLEYKPLEGMVLVPGVRYDYYTILKEGVPAFRMSSRYNYSRGSTVKASAGTYSQIPKPLGQSTHENLGNPDLGVSRSAQFVLGHECELSDLLSVDIQGYYNRQWDVPNVTDSVNASTGKPYNYLDDLESRMYGLEVMIKHNQSKRFFGWISYTLSRVERKASSPFALELNSAAEDWDANKWVLGENDQTHNFQALGSWKWPGNWETGFRLRYVTGNPMTPLKSYLGNEFRFDSDDLEYKEIPGEPFSDRVGPFVQLDLRADKRFVFNSWMLTAYLDLRNVNYFFYNSPEMYNYNYDKSQRETVGALFIPSFGLTAEF